MSLGAQRLLSESIVVAYWLSLVVAICRVSLVVEMS